MVNDHSFAIAGDQTRKSPLARVMSSRSAGEDLISFAFTVGHSASTDPDVTLPISSGTQISLKYLAEGAANVVYKVHTLNPVHGDAINDKCVLRLSKNHSSSEATKHAVRDFETHILPLFDRSLLLEHFLLKVPAEVFPALNESLIRLEKEGRRPAKRLGTFFASIDNNQEYYGILMPDLSAQGPGQHLIEFKPKWLHQSPSAPPDARRCRTCALRDMRHAANLTPGRGDSGFCPLDLCSSDTEILTNALLNLWMFDENKLPSFVAAFQSKVQPTLRHLADLQRQHNDVGLSNFQRGAGDFSVAMALRDCSVLIQVSDIEGEAGSLVAINDFRFADLDLKAPYGGKLEYWAKTELRLIEEGWYTGETAYYRGPRCALDGTQAWVADQLDFCQPLVEISLEPWRD